MKGHIPAELAAEGGAPIVTAETLVALREHGPFEPIATSIMKNDAVRDELASAMVTPSLRHHRRIRLGILAATAAPMATILELDRELLSIGGLASGGLASGGRMLVDALLVAFVVSELLRRTPRMPGVAALSLVAVALRWWLLAAQLCGRDAHMLAHLGAAVPTTLAAMVLLARVPSRSRVALELLGKLGITRSEFFQATRRPEPPRSILVTSIACALGLPALLHFSRAFGAGFFTQAVLFVAFGAIAPELARRLEPAGLGRPGSAPARALCGAAVGLTLAAASVTAVRLFFDTGAELARCLARLDAATRIARAAEAAEVARSVAQIRESVPLALMSCAVIPFAEERIFRGLLQEVLVRRYGTTYGIFAASIAFALAHADVHRVALHQTVLLGLGFGVARAEGGVLAAIVAHATWSLLMLA